MPPWNLYQTQVVQFALERIDTAATNLLNRDVRIIQQVHVEGGGVEHVDVSAQLECLGRAGRTLQRALAKEGYRAKGPGQRITGPAGRQCFAVGTTQALMSALQELTTGIRLLQAPSVSLVDAAPRIGGGLAANPDLILDVDRLVEANAVLEALLARYGRRRGQAPLATP